jgi:hypothetical protein
LGDLGSDWTNWRFKEPQVGPTMLLKRRPIFNSEIELVFEKVRIKIEARAQMVIAFAKLAIQTLRIIRNKHTLNQYTPFNKKIKGWMLCHVIDPWDKKNTNYARESTIRLQLSSI